MADNTEYKIDVHLRLVKMTIGMIVSLYHFKHTEISNMLKHYHTISCVTFRHFALQMYLVTTAVLSCHELTSTCNVIDRL